MSSPQDAGSAEAGPPESPPNHPPSAASHAPNDHIDHMDVDYSAESGPLDTTPQSQPMTATVSASSEQQSMANDLAGAGYGTRSRNRPAGARPNYADDKEIDMEIEAAGKIPKPNKKTAAVQAASLDDEIPSTRSSVQPVNGQPITQALDEPAPVSNGIYNVLPPAATSKKRKQPGSNNTVASAQTTPQRLKSANGLRSQFVETNMMSFADCRSGLNARGQLVADDGTVIEVNDHLYFVCEPPGEPYYFGRIMEFLHVSSDSNSPVDAVRVNWFYRPKDIQRRVQDTRVVFASMHSDTCPLTSVRGKCNIQHLSTISDLDEYRKQRDSFWFDKLYDRYMLRYYEVIPTSKVVNVPSHVKKVLDERWNFVLVEVGRSRDLTSASKKCKRCSDFAANHNSVDCAVCKNTYHMHCVRPPLLKKPARGFAWACAPCSRIQEMKMEARHTPNGDADINRLTEGESFDEEDEDSQSPNQITRDSSAGPESHPEPTSAQLAQANLWPWRYLGIHSRPEDALDYDDRIYPRASSRLGPRHQANVNVWHDRPIEYIKPAEAKKRYKPTGGAKKDAKTAAALENDKREKRPKWVLDEPSGYVARGSDDPIEIKGKKEYTAQLTFKMPDPSKFTERGLDDRPQNQMFDGELEDYMTKCDDQIAPMYNLRAGNVDVRTKALEKLQEFDYDFEKSFEAMQRLSLRADLKLPELNKEEVKRFEEGVSKFGSELHAVARFVSPTIKESRIVRFYYMWKKTPRGKEIWGNYEGRKSKKDSKRLKDDGNGAILTEDVADGADDSAFDIDKAERVKRGFSCKFCSTRSSRIWRRAPGTSPGTLVPRDPAAKNSKDRASWLVLALCGKCAYLWRRYAIQYESIEEIGKKIALSGGRASKRKVDEELMRIVLEAQSFTGDVLTKNTAQIASAAGVEVPAAMIEAEEPPKKKTKGEKDGPTPEVVVEKKKVPEKPVELEPLQPEPPKIKEHPCAVCHAMDDPQHKMLKCRDCRLHVHAACYGVTRAIREPTWYCDMCKNDHNTQVSTNYECVLCPVRITPQELMEPPKVSHKKKTDREREKERAERDMVQEAGRRWKEDQLAAGRPVNPREPLKRTAWNNWMHVNCAVWTKEIRFGDAEHLDAAEGVGFIPEERFRTACKLCKETGYPTVSCQFPACTNNFHVGCAHSNGYIFGFDISPVKMSRRDSVPVMKLDQEVGLAIPGIWCPNHTISTILHSMLETTPSDLTALQEYTRIYKQVDASTTGTVRRAAQFVHSQSALTAANPGRVSNVNGVLNHVEHASPSPMSVDGDINGASDDRMNARDRTTAKESKRCCTCFVEVSPRWWPVTANASKREGKAPETAHRPDGTYHSLSNGQIHQVKAEPTDEAMELPEEVLYQCHKCHVQGKTPPSSPSQAKRNHRLPPEPVPEPAYPTYPPGPAAGYPPPHSTLDSPAHAHPRINGIPPPQPAQHGWPPSNHSPWAGDRGPPPPPVAAAVYGHSSYRPGIPHEYGGYPYQQVPSAVPYASPTSLPPPGGSVQANGLPQHSPPPYPRPLHTQPRPLSHGPHPTSPQLPPGPPSTVPRGYGPDSHRPADPYLSHRGFVPPPPVPPVAAGMPRPPITHNLTQIAQSATDHSPHMHPSSRRQSIEEHGTPRLGVTRPAPLLGSPRGSHLGSETVGGYDGNRDREKDNRTSSGPGASANASLKNLLS